MKSDLIGKILKNQYKIIQHLDISGLGTVYLAQNITDSLNQNCVVKQFQQNYSSNSQLQKAKRLFIQEAIVLQRLGKHPQIPQIFDYFTEKESFFLVQEFIEGESLQQEFSRKEILTEVETQKLLVDVLNVLTFVHHNNYLHYDLKPSNLIRNKFNQKIFLVNFGAIKEKINPQNIDGSGNFKKQVSIHSIGYTSTEQLRGTPKFSSDIYALGILVIQALTGINPQELEYESNNNPIWQNFLPTGHFNSHFIKLINKMVVGDEAKRYQSTEQVLEDLNNLPKDIPSGILPKPPEPVAESTPKSKYPKFMGFAGLAIIVLGILASLWLFKSAQFISHQNANYGITIKYPKSWIKEAETGFSCRGIAFHPPSENISTQFQEEVQVCVDNVEKSVTFPIYTNRLLAEIKQNNVLLTSPETIQLDNQEGAKVVYQNHENKQIMKVWTVVNQKVYLITYIAEKDKYNQFLPDVEKIIDSLEIMAVE